VKSGARYASLAVAASLWTLAAAAEPGDSRIRTAVYAEDEVYRLLGYVGYQIDLEFARDESFVGLGAGDLEALTFAAQDNHLFLKPRAAGVATNLTVLTTRRSYHFQYLTATHGPEPQSSEVVYVLRFAYPAAAAAATAEQTVERALSQAPQQRAHNLAYGYCGSPALKPEAAWDDGIQTHLRFGARQELPAIFVHNEDGSESLVNSSTVQREVLVQRIARRLILRRGRLAGCVVNARFAGGGEALDSGTLSPAVRRVVRPASP